MFTDLHMMLSLNLNPVKNEDIKSVTMLYMENQIYLIKLFHESHGRGKRRNSGHNKQADHTYEKQAL